MGFEDVFLSVLVAAATGLCFSVAIEQMLLTRPPLLRPRAAWALHSGLWLLLFSVLTLLLGRTWFATAIVSAVLLTVILVNNAKEKSLQEPFFFQDYEYFTDTIRHPRLYIPFMGWGKFLLAAAGFVLAVSVGFLGEPVPENRFSLVGQSGAVLMTGGLGLLFVLLGNKNKLPVSFNPAEDLYSLGLLAGFWRYAQEERRPLKIVAPFAVLKSQKHEKELPHLVAVQSESFFDPRYLYDGIKKDVLESFDALKNSALAFGKLTVPAWGANTVRTEYAFLSGIDPEKLGVHRFNPYRTLVGGPGVASLASFLRGIGYRTICIHPYPASFYRRDRVYPRQGFDEFLDIRSFNNAERFGPYISDVALAEKVADLLKNANSPIFVFVITMENHGPLHLEQVAQTDIDELYSAPPLEGCEDLTIYLRHLKNADFMVASLRSTLEQCRQKASLCWYGDHVPIMPKVYSNYGVPVGEVDYCIWNNRSLGQRKNQDLYVQDLAMEWLRFSGII